jgi:hypothetical protein
MLTLCESCGCYALGDGEITCPKCGKPLCSEQPPASEAADPATGSPEPYQAETPPQRGWGRCLVERAAAAPAGIGAAFFLVIVILWIVTDRMAAYSPHTPQFAGSSRIKVGMHMSEVGQVLDSGPQPTPSYPRLRDSFPADEFGDGTIEYEGDGVILIIHFVGGRVTSVEESPSTEGPGFHRCRLTVQER